MAKKINAQAIENAENTIVEEGANMAENKVIENVEAIEEVAGPKAMLLFTASRGKNTRFAWNELIINPEDPTVKVKGCAIELPVKAAEIIGNDKFVSYIEEEIIARCVAEQKAVRGTASTVSDVYNRYIKVTDAKGERVAVALAVFKEVLEAIAAGNTNGEWVRPEPEKAEEEAPEAPAEEIPAEVENIEAPEEA